MPRNLVLAKAREAAGMSRSQLAKAIRVSPGRVGQIETGVDSSTSRPSFAAWRWESIYQLLRPQLDEMGCDLADLIRGRRAPRGR